MRPPLRVEAKVAEELRNWLTSELERLDASNTNPFAHHVVTILLQEDLDIEDEPLSNNDCFDTWGLRTVRQIKTRDKQIKAAVQFLRSAIASEESVVESEIEIIVNELVIRIEATKQKLNRRKSRGRELLGALTIYTDNQQSEADINADNREGERTYNEVFPSLPGDTPLTKAHSTLLISPNNSVWNKSPPVKENSNLSKVRRLPLSTVRKVRFADKDEAEACTIAAHVFALTIPEVSLPNPEAMEVPVLRSRCSKHPAHVCDANPFGSIWKSAFYSVKPTSKLFSPYTGTLPPPYEIKPTISPPKRKPIVIQTSCLEDTGFSVSSKDLFKLVNLLDPEAQKVFLPAEPVFRAHRPDSELNYLESLSTDSTDLELIEIYHCGREIQRQKIANRARQPSKDLQVNGSNDEIQGALAFPNHFGAYWEDMASQGAISIYPDLGEVLPSQDKDGHQRAMPKGNDNGNDLGAVGGDLGAVGGILPNDRESDHHESCGNAWDSVTFTDDLYDFALQRMADLDIDTDDRKRADGAAADYNSGDEPYSVNQLFSDLYCPIGAGISSRGIIASSDSGILMHGVAERTSASPCSEPPLSAPAAFQVPPTAWPLDIPRRQRRDDVRAYGSLDRNCPCCKIDAASELELPPPSVFDSSSRNQDLATWPKPPEVGAGLTLTSNIPLDGQSHSFAGIGSSAVWSSSLGESSWDHIQRSIFPLPTLTSGLSLLQPTLDSPATMPHHLANSSASSESLPLSAIPLAFPIDMAPFTSSPTTVFTSERSGGWPSPPPVVTEAVSQPLSTAPTAAIPAASPAFPSFPIRRYFLPSELSPGTGMENTVARTLQSAYVNSIFNNLPESVPDLKSASSAVNCADLEYSWFSTADASQGYRELKHPLVSKLKDLIMFLCLQLILVLTGPSEEKLRSDASHSLVEAVLTKFLKFFLLFHEYLCIIIVYAVHTIKT